MLFIFYRQIFFKKNHKYQLSCKYVRWDLSCFVQSVRHTDGPIGRQVDMTKLLVVFGILGIHPKIAKKWLRCKLPNIKPNLCEK